MRFSPLVRLPLALALAACGAFASAAPLSIGATMTPKEQIKLDFADGTGHFVLMVRREGHADGTGLLAGTSVTEYGRHDIVPGVGAEPSGYLVFTDKAGDIAYVRWLVHGVFVRGAEGKPVLLDNGLWEVVSGTGKFKGLKGSGTLHIKPAGPVDRRFTLDGELVPAAEAH